MGPTPATHLSRQSLAAIAGLGLDHTRGRALLNTIDAYTLGHVMGELAERETQRREGITSAEWRDETQAYFQRLIDSGAFPHLAAHGSGDVLPRAPDETFTSGLDWLLAGVATTL